MDQLGLLLALAAVIVFAFVLWEKVLRDKFIK